MGSVAVTRLTPSDVDAFVAFRRKMLANAPWAFATTVDDDVAIDPKFVSARLADVYNAVFLGKVTDEIVGAVGVFRQQSEKFAHRAKLWGFFVDEGHRGQGVGRALLVELLALVRRWDGIEYIDLGVSEAAPAAQHLYESLGFVAWGREPGATAHEGRRLDEIHMTLRLSPPA